MQFEIKKWTDGTVIFSTDADTWKSAIEAAVKAHADISYADLRSADLRYTNISYANLSYADLGSADLSYANLRSANLRYANLSYANLRSANLRYANLSSADLRSANLRSANLGSADLRSAKELPDTLIIETGETWKQYLDEIVPALLSAGSGIVTPESWTCHSWNNCPMHQAFGAQDIYGVPLLLRPRAEQFIRYFDAQLIPVSVLDKVRTAKKP